MDSTDGHAIDLRYRLDVLAVSVADAVANIGGWLFDRTMGGWQVTVMVRDRDDDPAPLGILGAAIADLDGVFDSADRRPAALSVTADLYSSDSRVRAAVRRWSKSSAAEITVCGPGRPTDLRRAVTEAQHHLTLAAQAYKFHALKASGLPAESVDPVESIGWVRRNGRVAYDIVDERQGCGIDCAGLPNAVRTQF